VKAVDTEIAEEGISHRLHRCSHRLHTAGHICHLLFLLHAVRRAYLLRYFITAEGSAHAVSMQLLLSSRHELMLHGRDAEAAGHSVFSAGHRAFSRRSQPAEAFSVFVSCAFSFIDSCAELISLCRPFGPSFSAIGRAYASSPPYAEVAMQLLFELFQLALLHDAPLRRH